MSVISVAKSQYSNYTFNMKENKDAQALFEQLKRDFKEEIRAFRETTGKVGPRGKLRLSQDIKRDK